MGHPKSFLHYAFRSALIAALVCILGSTGEAAPWPGVKFAEVRAFYYNPEPAEGTKNILHASYDGSPLVKDGRLHPSVKKEDGVVLPPAKLEKLLTILNSKRTIPAAVDGCYLPHHGVVFFDNSGTIVAAYEFCIMCGGQRSEPKGLPLISEKERRGIPKGYVPINDMAAIVDLFEELKVPFGPAQRLGEFRKEWATEAQRNSKVSGR